MAVTESEERPSLQIDRQKQRKRSRELESLMREWYGENAPGAMAKHLPKPESVGDVLARLTKKLVPPWVRAMETVVANWQEIVGETGAKRLTPIRFDGTTLLLELKHPAYRMAFDAPAVKEAMIRKINEVAQSEICKAVKFVAPGMFAKK